MSATENLVSQFEGETPPQANRDAPVACSYCGCNLYDDERVTAYVSSYDCVRDVSGLTLQRVYCSLCRVYDLAVPVKDEFEAILGARYSDPVGEDDPTLDDVRLFEYSTRVEGIPWRPAECWNAFVAIPFDEMVDNLPDDAGLSAIAVHDILEAQGVDVGDAIDSETGEVTPPTERLTSLARASTPFC